MKNGLVIDRYGTEWWLLNNKCHRTGGPAVVYTDGTQYWYRNGKLHRTDGPAVIDADGPQRWHLNGKLHRTDGPAVMWASGNQWWLNGKEYTFNDFCKKANLSYDDELVLRLKYKC